MECGRKRRLCFYTYSYYYGMHSLETERIKCFALGSFLCIIVRSSWSHKIQVHILVSSRRL